MRGTKESLVGDSSDLIGSIFAVKALLKGVSSSEGFGSSARSPFPLLQSPFSTL